MGTRKPLMGVRKYTNFGGQFGNINLNVLPFDAAVTFQGDYPKEVIKKING